MVSSTWRGDTHTVNYPFNRANLGSAEDSNPPIFSIWLENQVTRERYRGQKLNLAPGHTSHRCPTLLSFFYLRHATLTKVCHVTASLQSMVLV